MFKKSKDPMASNEVDVSVRSRTDSELLAADMDGVGGGLLSPPAPNSTPANDLNIFSASMESVAVEVASIFFRAFMALANRCVDFMLILPSPGTTETRFGVLTGFLGFTLGV